jgi:hypothetical protein
MSDTAQHHAPLDQHIGAAHNHSQPGTPQCPTSDRLASQLIGYLSASHDRHANAKQIEKTAPLVEELFSNLDRAQIESMRLSYHRMTAGNMRSDIVTNHTWDKEIDTISIYTKGNDRASATDKIKCAEAARDDQDQKLFLRDFSTADKPTRIAMRCLLDQNDRLQAGNCIYTITSQGNLRTLSTDAAHFNKLFPSPTAQIKQGNYGTCYLDSSLLGIARTKFGEFYLADMIKPAGDGAWNVTLPTEPNKPFKVTDADIDTYFWQKGGVTADLGLRVLEAAYGMHRVRLGQVPKHNLWDEVTSDLESCTLGGTKTPFLAAGTGGNPGSTLNDFTRANASFSPAWDKENVYHALDNWATQGPDLVIEASSQDGDHYKGNTYLNWTQFSHTPDREHNVIFNHAYSVLKINAKAKTVLLANPWDSSKPFTESYENFFKFFVEADAVQLDSFRTDK